MVSVSFRFDDPSPVSNQQLEQNIIAIFEKNNINLCIGVVPFAEHKSELCSFTPRLASHLLEANRKGTIEIALHGYSHTKRGCGLNNAPSEFVGLPETEQAFLLSKAKRELSATFGHITGFIPPWNSYDNVTEKILKELGFCFVSAGWDAPPASSHYLPNVARTAHLHYAQKTLQQACSFKDLDPVINVLFHHFDFAEETNDSAVFDLTRLDELLFWINKQQDISCIPLSQSAAKLESYSPKKNLCYHQRLEQIPARLRWRFPQNMLLLSPFRKIIWSVLSQQISNIFNSRLPLKLRRI